MKTYKVISSILIPRTGRYFQSGRTVTSSEVIDAEAASLIEKKAIVLEENLKEEPVLRNQKGEVISGDKEVPDMAPKKPAKAKKATAKDKK